MMCLTSHEESCKCSGSRHYSNERDFNISMETISMLMGLIRS